MPIDSTLPGLTFSHPQFTHRLPSTIPGSNVSSVQPKAEKLYDEAPQRRNLQKHGGEFHGTRSKILWSFFLLGSLAVVVMVVTSKLVNHLTRKPESQHICLFSGFFKRKKITDSCPTSVGAKCSSICFCGFARCFLLTSGLCAVFSQIVFLFLSNLCFVQRISERLFQTDLKSADGSHRGYTGSKLKNRDGC